MRNRILLLLFFWHIPLALFANGESAGQTIEVTVIAEAPALDSRATAAQVTVIGKEEIEASYARNAAELVQSVVGIDVQRYGSASQPSTISVRGASPEQVRVLVNASPMNSASGGGVDLNTIRVNDIERIEVIRGGGSAIYGEHAIGGVINIVTKDGYGKSFQANAEYGYGSFNTHTVTADVLGSVRRFDYFLSGHCNYTEGNFRFKDAHEGSVTRVNEQGISGSASFKTGFDINTNLGMRIALSGTYAQDKKGVPGRNEFPSENATLHDERITGTFAFMQTKRAVVSYEARIHANLQKRRYSDPEYALGNVDDYHEALSLITGLTLRRADAWRRLSMRHTLEYTFQQERLYSTALLKTNDGTLYDDALARATHSVLLHSAFDLAPYDDTKRGRVTLYPAIRFDHHSAFGGRPSASLGIFVPFESKAKSALKGTLASAYRLPSFSDLFWPTTAFAAGNASLQPETALIYDIGIITRPTDFLTLELAHFRHIVDNLIQWNPGADGRWRPENIGHAELKGLEAEAGLLFTFDTLKMSFEARGNYTFLFAFDLAEGSATYGKQLPRRPYERANLVLTLSHFKGYALRMENRYVGYRFATAQNTKAFDAYVTSDLAFTATLFKHIALRLTVKNLFDTAYVDIRDYPVPGREFGAAIAWTY